MTDSEERFARQIKKGVLEMLVLRLLSQKSGYGYELLTRLSLAPEKTLCVKEGTLYPILYRLEEDGLLTSGWQTGDGRAAPKKIYTVTEKGLAELESKKQVWNRFILDVSFILNAECEENENQ